MVFEGHSRIIPQIIRANLVQLRASSVITRKYRASRPDKRTARRTSRVSLVREELKLSGRYLMVDRSTGVCIPFLRAENDDRSCAISTSLRHAGEKAVDIIEGIRQLPAEISIRQVRIISPKYSHSFSLISIIHYQSFKKKETRESSGKLFVLGHILSPRSFSSSRRESGTSCSVICSV